MKNGYEILKEDIKQKKLYFYENYQEYIESCFYFQSFYLLQYEEIIKRIHKQIWEYEKSSLNYFQNFGEERLYKINLNLYYSVNSNQIYTINFKTNDSFGHLYYTCFAVIEGYCFGIEDIILSHYYALSSPLTTDNYEFYDIIRIPMYDNIALMKLPLYEDLFSTTLFGFDPYKIFFKTFELGNNSFNRTKLNEIYDTIYNQTYERFKEIAKYTIIDRPPLVEYMFGKIIKEIENEIDLYKGIAYMELTNIATGYLSNIDYGNNKFISMNNIIHLMAYIYVETELIDDFLYFINNKLNSFIDVNFIPLYSENSTIISPELCILFLLKQTDFQMDEERRNILDRKSVV